MTESNWEAALYALLDSTLDETHQLPRPDRHAFHY
jgi:hypothetical protein